MRKIQQTHVLADFPLVDSHESPMEDIFHEEVVAAIKSKWAGAR
jgi:hypothetical protein